MNNPVYSHSSRSLPSVTTNQVCEFSSARTNINTSNCQQDMNVLIIVSLVYLQVTGFITAASLIISLGLPHAWQYFGHALG